MIEASTQMRYEEAIEYRDLLTSIDTVVQKQTMELMIIFLEIFWLFSKRWDDIHSSSPYASWKNY